MCNSNEHYTEQQIWNMENDAINAAWELEEALTDLTNGISEQPLAPFWWPEEKEVAI